MKTLYYDKNSNDSETKIRQLSPSVSALLGLRLSRKCGQNLMIT